MANNTKVVPWTRALKKFQKKYKAASSVLNQQMLWRAVNNTLPKEDQIALSTFENWISPNPENIRSVANQKDLTDFQREGFINAIEMFKIENILELSKQSLNYIEGKNAGIAYNYLTKLDTELKDKPQGLLLGSGGITLNIQSASPNHEEFQTIDIEHQEIDPEQLGE